MLAKAKRLRILAGLLDLETEILNVLFCDFKIPNSIAIHIYFLNIFY
jgi:hypothetical protein